MHADDVVAVAQLAAYYADAMTRGDVHEACQVYAPDGILESPTTPPALGRDAVEATIAATTASLEFVFQTVHQGVIEVSGDRARARFPITEWGRRASDDRPFLFLGWYEDEAIRLPEGWRLSRRRLVPRMLARPDFLSGPLKPVSGLALTL